MERERGWVGGVGGVKSAENSCFRLRRLCFRSRFALAFARFCALPLYCRYATAARLAPLLPVANGFTVANAYWRSRRQ